MVQVVESKEDAGQAECIEFRVYQSPRDPNRVLASWQFAHMEPVGPKGAIAIDQSQLGTLVETEFQRVLYCAAQHGVPFIWVNNSNGLFPPSKRPSS